MGSEPQSVIKAANRLQEDFKRQTKTFFEPQLTGIGLSEEQINSYSLPELQRALERINDAIKNPDSFGVLTIKLNAVGSVSIAPKQESQIQIGILPMLLERKNLILDRIQQLKGNEKLENLQDLVENISDESLKDSFKQELNALKEDAKKLREEKDKLIQLQNSEIVKSQTETNKLKIELLESRARIIRSFLERESVATIVGGIIIIVFGLVEIIAVFLKLPVPSELHNILLLVLGYFFGQYSGGRGETSKQLNHEANEKQ